MDPGQCRSGCERWARRLALAPLIGVLFCLGAPALAGAAGDPDPSKLWEAFPLEQKPTQVDRRVASVIHSVDYRYVSAVRPGGLSGGGELTDSRLVLQLGMLLAFLYVAFLGLWFASTRHLRLAGVGRLAATVPRRRGADRWPARRRSRSGAWTCRTVWIEERRRFGALAQPPGGGTPRLLGESARVSQEREREPGDGDAHLGELIARLEAAGWKPSGAGGERFTWSRRGETPAALPAPGTVRGARRRFGRRSARDDERVRDV